MFYDFWYLVGGKTKTGRNILKTAWVRNAAKKFFIFSGAATKAVLQRPPPLKLSGKRNFYFVLK